MTISPETTSENGEFALEPEPAINVLSEAKDKFLASILIAPPDVPFAKSKELKNETLSVALILISPALPRPELMVLNEPLF